MKQVEDNIDYFDRAFSNSLTTQEKEAFEDALKNNKQLKSNYEAYKLARFSIHNSVIQEELQSVIANSKEEKFRFTFKSYLYIAASLLIIAISFFLIRDTNTIDKVFYDHFEPYPLIISVRSNPNTMNEAYEEYSKKDYKAALVYFEKMANKSDTAFFYMAICQLSNNKAEEALSSFNQINSQSVFHNIVHWYKGLTYFKLQNIDSATYLLKTYRGNKNREVQAKEILENVN